MATFLVAVLCAVTAYTQAADPVLERVQAEAKNALDQWRVFERAGGQRDSPEHPARAAGLQLWTYREKHPDTPAAKLATVEALRLLSRARAVAELRRLMALMPPDDPAWDDLISVLREAAADAEHGAFFLQKVEQQLARSTASDRRARFHLALGRIHAAASRQQDARTHFLESKAASPASNFAAAAADELYDMDVLVVGKAAPVFSVISTAGEKISNDTLTGHVTVFVYWASW